MTMIRVKEVYKINGLPIFMINIMILFWSIADEERNRRLKLIKMI